jgi:two-component system, sporulation sensor kinase E
MEGILEVEIRLMKLFEEIFEQAQEMIVVLHRSRKIAYINSIASEVLRISKSANQYLMITEDCDSIWQQFIEELQENSNASCAINIQKNEAGVQKIKLVGYILEGQQLIFCRVVKQQKMNISYRKKSVIYPYDQMINSMPYGVILTSLQGKIISANDQALQLLESQFWQIENRSYDCLFEDFHYDSTQIAKYYKKIASKELSSITVQKQCNDGQTIHLNFSSKIDESLGILITTIHDDTEMNIMKEKMNQQQNLSLIGQNVMSIAHEIRNPITSIQGFIQLLKHQSSDKDTYPYFHILETELQRMDELLIDMLSMSKPSSLSKTHVNLQQLIEQILVLMQSQIQRVDAKIIFNYNEQEIYIVKGYEKRLKQLIINLLKNALEAMEPNNCITINLQHHQNNQLRMSIKDTGYGISQENINSVFNPFFTTKQTGTGLGLILVQAVVEEHNGKIFVESEEGNGTKFIVEFESAKSYELNNYSLPLKNYTNHIEVSSL